MIEINSSSNERFKSWSQLVSSKGIKKQNEFLLMGEKLIQEFLNNPQFEIKAELLTTGMQPLLKDSKRVFKLSADLFQELDSLGTHFNLFVLELPQIQTFEPSLPKKGFQMVAPLGDPANLGALIRSAVGFGAHSVVLTKESAHPFHPKSVKASAGSLFQCHLMTTTLSLEEFVQQVDQTAALDLSGSAIQDFKPDGCVRLIVGEEGPGVGKLKTRYRLKIETQEIESLNATVAASIAMWELSKN